VALQDVPSGAGGAVVTLADLLKVNPGLLDELEAQGKYKRVPPGASGLTHEERMSGFWKPKRAAEVEMDDERKDKAA